MKRHLPTALLLILAIALAVRLAVVVATPGFQPFFDAVDYDYHARSIADGHGYPAAERTGSGPTAYRPPLYPVTLAGVYVLGGGRTAGRVLGALLGTLAVYLVFLVSGRLWDRRVALVAAALCAVFPPLVLLNASLLSESLFIPIMLGAVWAILRWRADGRLRWALAAGALCGLCALTRSVGTLLVLAAVVGVWTVRPRLSRAALRAPVAVAGAALVTVMPWLLRNAIEFHRPIPLTTQGGYGLAGTYNQESRDRPERPGYGVPTEQLKVFRADVRRKDLDEAALSNRLAKKAVSYAFHNPDYVAATWFWNTLRVFDLHHDMSFNRGFEGLYLMANGAASLVGVWIPASVYLMLILALLGGVAQALRPGRRAPPFLWAFVVVMLLPGIAVYGISRYRAPADPFLLMLAAVALVAAADRIRSRVSDRLAVRA